MVLLTVGTTAAITLYLPKTYRASVTFQVIAEPSFFLPGYTQSGSQKVLDYGLYEQLIYNPSFKRAVFNLAKEKDRSAMAKGLNSTAFSMTISGTPRSQLMMLNVDASGSREAKILADSAAEMLASNIAKLNIEGPQRLRSVSVKEIALIDEELAKLRRELESIKVQSVSTDQVRQNKKLSDIGSFEDQIDATLNLRKMYTDILIRIEFNDLLRQEQLQQVYPAVMPLNPSSPSLPNNLAISLVLGLAFGLLAAFLIEYNKSGKRKHIDSVGHDLNK